MNARPTVPANPFYAAPEQRVALARKRFFEDGERPSGIVSEAVIQSWFRCLRTHPDPARPAVFEPVTASRVHGALRNNRQLLEAAGDELQRLRVVLAGTTSTAMLTDAQGVIVGSTFEQPRSHEQLMPITTRIGVCLAEDVVGTNAPGLTARSGMPSVVLGGEHFFGNVQMMHCAAAPIRDVQGQIAGVLDLSSEGVPFGFDAATVVAQYAVEIENRLLCAQSTEHLVLRLQMAPALLDTPLAALLGITGDGRIDWLNGAAARLLGLNAAAGQRLQLWAADVLGMTLDTLTAMSTRPGPQALHLPNGLTLWMRCEWRSRDGPRPLHAAALNSSVSAAAAAPAPTAAVAAPPAAPHSSGALALAQGATLRDTERATVARVLAECGGNVSQAARTLGVSRGRVYRHLQQRD